MKEELTQVTVEALRGLMENLTRAKVFVLEQAPDILKEMVLLQRVQVTASFVFGVILLCVGIPLCFKGAKWRRVWLEAERHSPTEKEADRKSDLYGCFGAFSAVIGLVVSVSTFFPLTQAWFAPKVFLVEQIMHMLK